MMGSQLRCLQRPGRYQNEVGCVHASGNGEDCGRMPLLDSAPVHFCQVETKARFSDILREDGNLEFSVNFFEFKIKHSRAQNNMSTGPFSQ